MVSNQEVYDKILVCLEMDCLADIWKSNPDLHSNEEFKKLVTERKTWIAEFDRVENVLELIKSKETVEQVEEILENEKNEEVLKAGAKQIELFNNQNQ
jgi:hypothetical protein